MTDRRVEPRLSVVIPAHNEAAVIRRTLDALFAGVDPADLDVVVACNGCTDDTAGVVLRSGYPVRVVEAQRASKIEALRVGDAAVSVFPRIYLDADVELTGRAALAVAEVLAAGNVLAARPPLRYDTAGASWLVQRYYSARSQLPEVLDSLWGAGCYAVNAAGHDRIAPWPDVLADDLYVDRSFARAEISVVDAQAVAVRVPRSSSALLRVLGRTYEGKQDDAPSSSAPQAGPTRTLSRTVTGLVRLMGRRPFLALDLAVYAGFAVAARALRQPWRAAKTTEWKRDDTTRVA